LFYLQIDFSLSYQSKSEIWIKKISYLMFLLWIYLQVWNWAHFVAKSVRLILTVVVRWFSLEILVRFNRSVTPAGILMMISPESETWSGLKIQICFLEFDFCKVIFVFIWKFNWNVWIIWYFYVMFDLQPLRRLLNLQILWLVLIVFHVISLQDHHQVLLSLFLI